ncbi:hypothetical protein C1645_42226 [Glomus cerebriforme]|uniref:F-box domain-containing protein n=1 Tax=Glomus cerebriforme TaxID=658196 RepID=A0A397T402_9GLOM|nr:hypothetical protein C1645_42226 [Glomus cerebriforme]
MSKLNKDVLFLILEELQTDRKSLYSCLLVNKAWCEIIVPILWKNPLKYSLNLIISHLSNETRGYLKSQGIDLSSIVQRKPSFNYIRFVRYLDLIRLEGIIQTINIEEYKISIMTNEILKLFINRDTKFTHLYIPSHFNYQIHLILGAEYCFSGLKFLYCCTDNTNQNILEGLAQISRSTRKLELYVFSNNNFGIIKLIEAQKNLNEVLFYCQNKSIRKALEDSLNKHLNTVKYIFHMLS